jgi:hypothetical protein
MVLYGVVRRQTEESVEFFATREEAESTLHEAHREDAGADAILGLVRVDLISGEWDWRPT